MFQKFGRVSWCCTCCEFCKMFQFDLGFCREPRLWGTSTGSLLHPMAKGCSSETLIGQTVSRKGRGQGEQPPAPFWGKGTLPLFPCKQTALQCGWMEVWWRREQVRISGAELHQIQSLHVGIPGVGNLKSLVCYYEPWILWLIRFCVLTIHMQI